MMFDLLSPRTCLRLSLYSGPNLGAKTPTHGEAASYAPAAQDMAKNGTTLDAWRLVIMLLGFDGVIDEADVVPVALSLGDHPTMETARRAVSDLEPEAAAFVLEALEGLS